MGNVSALLATLVFLVTTQQHWLLVIEQSQFFDITEFSNETSRSLDSCPNALEEIKEKCSTYELSCRNRCNTTIIDPELSRLNVDYHYKAVCGCDPLCVAYDDCCWDFTTHCPAENQLGTNRFGYLRGVGSSCILGQRFITGCSLDSGDPNLDPQKTTDLRVTIATIILEDNSTINYKNLATIHCNHPNAAENQVIFWNKNLSGGILSKMDLVQDFLDTGELPTGSTIRIVDVQPEGIPSRYCFDVTQIFCSDRGCPKKLQHSLNSPLQMCLHAHTRNRLTKRDVDSWEAGKALSTTTAFSTSYHSSPITGDVEDRDICIIQVISLLNRRSSNSYFSLIFDVSNPATAQLVSWSEVEGHWKSVNCVGKTEIESKSRCELDVEVECGWGTYRVSRFQCVVPQVLNITVESKSDSRLNILTAYVESDILDTSPVQYLKKIIPEPVASINVNGTYKKSILWDFLHYPFDDKDSLPTPSLVLKLRQALGNGFVKSDSISLCISFLGENQCFDVIPWPGIQKTTVPFNTSLFQSISTTYVTSVSTVNENWVPSRGDESPNMAYRHLVSSLSVCVVTLVSSCFCR